MAGRFINPFPQFFNSTPTPYVGAKLFFYAAGTSTKLNTYSDRTLSSANTNPVVLNAAGYPDVEIWLQDLDYKVVLAPSTDTDPPTSPIWSSDYVRARDSALIAKTLTGSGSPSGTVAGTAGSSSILPDFYWDYTNSILYVCTTTGTSSTAVWTAVNASTAAAVVPPPQGYLTLTSGVTAISGDVTAATAVYYTPDKGSLVPIYNGSSFNPTTFTELTLTLSSSHVASNIYDVFVFSNSGVVTIGTGPSWSAGTSGSITAGSCARGTGAGGTALTRVSGIYTNTVQITARNGATTYTVGANQGTYVGTIFMDGTNGQVSCYRAAGQSRKWSVWNAYNQRMVELIVTDPNTNWTYSTNTIRQSRADPTNKATILVGLQDGICAMNFAQRAQISDNASATVQAQNGIGFNSVTVISGTRGHAGLLLGGTSGYQIEVGMRAAYTAVPAIGIHDISALEITPDSGTTILYSGTESHMRLSAQYLA
jgi:hypothetical protein